MNAPSGASKPFLGARFLRKNLHRNWYVTSRDSTESEDTFFRVLIELVLGILENGIWMTLAIPNSEFFGLMDPQLAFCL